MKSGRSVPCVYFDSPGKENTGPTLEAAAKRAGELGVANILVATTSGETGLLAADVFAGNNLIIVTHSTGFWKPGYQQLKQEYRTQIENKGAKILTCQHSFGGVGRAVRRKWGTYELEELIASTLRTFGQGTKVAIEIALMAADAGLVPTEELCISVGGSAEGADTALLLQPVNAQDFFDLKIVEIVAKPRLV